MYFTISLEQILLILIIFFFFQIQWDHKQNGHLIGHKETTTIFQVFLCVAKWSKTEEKN